MPATAAGLGTSTDDLLNMSNVDQLDYVLLTLNPTPEESKQLTIFSY